MSFVVAIDQFDGPLDLMLHLIKEKELDIFNLDISVLTQQYIDYIHQMQDLHLDVASEFLVEMAMLIEYKSKKLLPLNDANLDDNFQQEQQQQDIVKRLIEYQKYKEVTQVLEKWQSERELLHDKPQSEIVNEWLSDNKEYKQTSPYELIKAMNKVLSRYSIANPYEVSVAKQRITVEDRIEQIQNRIKHLKETFTLEILLDDCKDKYDVVITFLSILTMINDNDLLFTITNEVVYFKKGDKR